MFKLQENAGTKALALKSRQRIIVMFCHKKESKKLKLKELLKDKEDREAP